MIRRIFTYLIWLSIGLPLLAAQPKYEMRAVWLTTNWGLDWPSHPARSEQEIIEQQKELCLLLDEVSAMGFNTVFFQARIRGEVFYASNIEPWSSVVSGKAGRSPGYDPLTFVIEECHKRKLECHAWLVTIPVGSVRQARQQGSRAVPVQKQKLCVKLKNNWYLNPGHPQTADYVASLAGEIAHRYDVDGIHLDYIRYPDEEGVFPDRDTYRTYAHKGESLQEWRMRNITRIVEKVYSTVKAANKKILVSTAPLGRYTSIAGHPPVRWSCMGGVSQDAVSWVQKGYNDFVVPMMYYRDENYYPYLVDWKERLGKDGYVVAGLGAYRLERNEGNWSVDELQHQIKATRQYGVGGQAFFRMEQIIKYQALAQFLSWDFYRLPALIPPVAHADTTSIAAVEGLYMTEGVLSDTLRWNPVEGALRYVVYASSTDKVDVSNAEHIVQAWVTETMLELPVGRYNTIAVTAIDAHRRETPPAVCHRNTIPHILPLLLPSQLK